MNYWILTTEYPPMHGGGISTYCAHTAAMLTQNGHRVTVFTQDFDVSNCTETVSEHGVRVVHFHPFRTPELRVLGYEARMSYEICTIVEEYIQREGPPDVIETQDYLGLGYYVLQKKALLYRAFRDVKLIVTAHAPGFLYLDYNQVPCYKLPHFWTGEMEKACLRMADMVISPSHYLLETLQQHVFLLNVPNVQLFNPYKLESSASFEENPPAGKRVSFFGKLTPQKGGLELLSAMQKAWDAGADVPLSIIGGENHYFYPRQEDMGTYLRRKYARFFDLGLIHFTGNLNGQELENALAETDVVIVPSIIDNLPYTVIEAMARGKLVLASTDGGQRELITDGVNGFLFDHRIPGDLWEKLEYILGLAEEEAAVIRAAARDRVAEACDYDQIYQAKMALLDSVANAVRSQYPFREERTNASPQSDPALVANRLSVVIPYFDMGAYLETALESLYRVPWQDMEVIVVNDGSTDPYSLKMLRECQKHYHFRVIDQANAGLAATRNAGAALATGKYLAFLDPDDAVEPEYYPKALEILRHYENVHFVGCWAQYFGESHDLWPSFTPEPPYLLYHNMINSSALVCRTESFLAFGQNDPKMIYGMEDYDSVINMVGNGARGVALPEAWWKYRIRSNSMQQSFNDHSQLYLYRLIARKHNAFFGQYAAELSNLLNHNGPGYRVGNPTWEIHEPVHRATGVHFNGRLTQFIKRHRLLRRTAKWIYARYLS